MSTLDASSQSCSRKDAPTRPVPTPSNGLTESELLAYSAGSLHDKDRVGCSAIFPAGASAKHFRELLEVVVPLPRSSVSNNIKTALSPAGSDIDQVRAFRGPAFGAVLVGVTAEDKDDYGCFAALGNVNSSGT